MRTVPSLILGILAGFVFLQFVDSRGLQADSQMPTATANTDDDDEPEQVPGLLGTYTSSGQVARRKDSTIHFNWEKSGPDQRLGDLPFQARWVGKLLVKSPGKYRLHARIQGSLELKVGDQTALQGTSHNPEWISGAETAFEYGEHSIDILFTSAQSEGNRAESSLKLYWSSDSFALEPIPATNLFMIKADPDLDLVVQGKALFGAHRCNRCHHSPNDPVSPPGPDLSHLGTGLTPGWLHDWFQNRAKTSRHSKMPEFDFTAKESRYIQAFLLSNSQPVELNSLQPKSAQSADLIQAGKVLFHSLGCLACHQVESKEESGPFAGHSLEKVGEKRSLAWIHTWLTNPSKLNADHRMPVFSLKKEAKIDETLQLAAYLSSLRHNTSKAANPAKPPEYSVEEIAEGKKLVEAARCAACHRISGIESNAQNVVDLNNTTGRGNDGCLSKIVDRSRWRPAFPTINHAAVRAYLNTRPSSLSPESLPEKGQRLLAWNNCLLCHPRETTAGLSSNAALAGESIPELTGQRSTLVPPSLNAVGDKMRDDALMKAVAGDFSASRMPWLKVRMPRFRHTSADQAALAQYLIHSDRIEAPPVEIAAQPVAPPENQKFAFLAAGHTLLGSQGFSCISCHSFGKFEPRHTALGTRGSDLKMIGQRMRREFFLRWTRSPIRIVPNMEMPSFDRPVAGLLEGRIDSQLSALWEALQDPDSSRPLEVSAIQQNLVVKTGEPARIVRDVFSVSQQGQEIHIPRAFAVGFGNQQNLLIDLDTFRLREWWLGDFARQRTEGKSWYWDVGGTRVATTLGKRPDLALIRGIGTASELIEPLSQYGVVGTLEHYQRHDSGVQLRYRLQFPGLSPQEPLKVTVVETLTPPPPDQSQDKNSWKRGLEVRGIPDGFRAVFIQPELNQDTKTFEIVPQNGISGRWQQVEVKDREGKTNSLFVFELSMKPSDGAVENQAHGELIYLTLHSPIVREAPQPVVQVAKQESLNTVQGYSVVRLPLPRSIMPTAITWTRNGTLAFASLKGHVYLAKDTDGDGLEDHLSLFEEGLAAPYGLIADDTETGLIVSHKPELLRLRDTDGDGRADLRDVIATGWGYNDNYHDWTCGIVRDSRGRMYVGLGSDYTQPKRPRDQQRWRGKILRIDQSGQIEPISSGLRYPTGLAMNEDDQLFVTDNQGEQNTFNELNHIVPGARYGVPSLEDKDQLRTDSVKRAAIQFPHPWTRSINGIFFLPRNSKLGTGTIHPFAGHGIGCEYDTRYLIRFSLEKVGESFQGAVYPFSLDQVPAETPNFEGTLSGSISPSGDMYIGCIHDSGWLGGLNVGSIYRLRQQGQIPFGIREIRIHPEGFQIDFTSEFDPAIAAQPANASVSGYTREWQGNYATPDSQRHVVAVKSIVIAENHQSMLLKTDRLRPGFVYEITCGKIGKNPTSGIWPAIGHYTVNELPANPH